MNYQQKLNEILAKKATDQSETNSTLPQALNLFGKNKLNTVCVNSGCSVGRTVKETQEEVIIRKNTP